MTTFKTTDVEKFLLNSGNRFASLCWFNDMSNRDEVESTKVQTWFKNFFPSEVSNSLYRFLECECTQKLTF